MSVRGSLGSRRATSRARARLRSALASLLGAAALALAVGVIPAGAVVTHINGHFYGIAPVAGVNPSSLPGVARSSSSSGLDSTGNMTYHGGLVMHSFKTYAFFWDPAGAIPTAQKALINQHLGDVAHDSGMPTNAYAVNAQYTDFSGANAAYSSTFGGGLTDPAAYPASGCTINSRGFVTSGETNCLTDAQLTTELGSYISTNLLPTDVGTEYFIITPANVATCVTSTICSDNVYCAYHSSFGGGTLYADDPYTLAGNGHAKSCQSDGNGAIQEPNGNLADVVLKAVDHELSETATDPFGDGWFKTNGAGENGDKCNAIGSTAGHDPNAFLPTLGGSAGAGTLFNQVINGHNYYTQSEWSNGDSACMMQPTALTGPGFTVSGTTAGSPTSFGGSATSLYGPVNFSWSFGDGTTGTGPTTSHTYAAAGTYTVTMTPTDAYTAATTAPVTQSVTIAAAPSPPPPPPPPPVVHIAGSASVPHQKLGTVLSKGLLVNVVPNETVSAFLQALMGTSSAKKLGISGSTTASAAKKHKNKKLGKYTVIGQGTVGVPAGSHQVRLHFSSKTVKKLRKARSVTLTLRLTLSDASGQKIRLVGVVTLKK